MPFPEDGYNRRRISWCSVQANNLQTPFLKIIRWETGNRFPSLDFLFQPLPLPPPSRYRSAFSPAPIVLSVRTSKSGSDTSSSLPGQLLQPSFSKLTPQPIPFDLRLSPLPFPQRLPLTRLLFINGIQQLPLLFLDFLQAFLGPGINARGVDFPARCGLREGSGGRVVETLGAGVGCGAAVVAAEGGSVGFSAAVIVWGWAVVG